MTTGGPEQILDIPLGKGLGEGFDPKVLPFGAASKIENFEVTRALGITKRRGLGTALQMALTTGSAISTPHTMHAKGSALRQAFEGSDYLPHLGTYCEPLDGWTDQDSLTPCQIERLGMVSGPLNLATASVTPFGNGQYLLVVWGEYLTNVFYKIVDASTGATIKQAASLSDGFYSQARAVPLDDDVWVFYNHRTNGFEGRKIDGADFTESVISIDATAAAWMDANVYDLATAIVAYSYSGSSTLRFKKILNSTAIGDTGTYAAGGDVTRIAVCGSSSAGVQCVFFDATDFLLVRMLSDLSGTSGGPYTLEAAPAKVGNGTAIVMDGTTTVCAYEFADTATYQGKVKIQPVQSGGTLSTARQAFRCALASGLQIINNGVYVLLGISQDASIGVNNDDASLSSRYTAATYTEGSGITSTTTGSGPLFHVILAAVHNSNTNTILPVAKVGTFTAFKAFDQCGAKLWRKVSNQDDWYGAVVSWEGSQSAPLNLDALKLKMGRQQSGLFSPLFAGSADLSGGALVTTNDGTSNTELSFLHAPAWEEPVIGGAGGLASSTTGIVYLFRARYEWIDDRGLLHVSPWSPDLALTLINVPSPGFSYAVTLKVLCTQLTRRGRSQFGANRDVRIVIYGSEGNGASASGDVVFYRLFDWQNTPVNTTGYSVSFSARPGSTTLGYGQVVSPGDALAPVCPPAASHLCAHRGRVWLASGETGRDLWASRYLVNNEQPAFPPEFRVELADLPDRITALVSLDDKLVIFTPTRIYYLIGEGPADNGTGESWPQPWLITAQHGCIDARSVVVTPDGAFFQTSAGIALLNRGLQVSLVGEAIRDQIESHPVCLAAIHDATRSRAIWLLSNANNKTIGVVYDYLHQLWSRLTTTISGELRTLTAWNDLLVVGADGEVARSEATPTDNTVYGWDLDGASARVWVTGLYETPWICPGGPNAYQRIRRLILLGTRLGYCKLRIGIYTNFNGDSTVQVHDVVLDDTTTVAGLPLLRYELPLDIQACQAIKIVIADLEPESEPAELPGGYDPRTGVSLSRLALEYLPERGSPRLPATNRGGG